MKNAACLAAYLVARSLLLFLLGFLVLTIIYMAFAPHDATFNIPLIPAVLASSFVGHALFFLVAEAMVKAEGHGDE